MVRLSPKFLWAILPLIVGILTPSVIVFALETTVGRIAFTQALADVASRQFGEGENLFLLAVVSLIPFLVLSIFCLIAARFLPPARLVAVLLGGLVGILALMVPAHVSAWWPIYAGGHVSSTSAIAFLFIPIYCIGALAVGLVIGWAISLVPFFRRLQRRAIAKDERQS
ncbi:MAG: hypothetical protein ABR514_07460 [Chthoniobacterales bacterium]